MLLYNSAAKSMPTLLTRRSADPDDTRTGRDAENELRQETYECPTEGCTTIGGLGKGTSCAIHAIRNGKVEMLRKNNKIYTKYTCPVTKRTEIVETSVSPLSLHFMYAMLLLHLTSVFFP